MTKTTARRMTERKETSLASPWTPRYRDPWTASLSLMMRNAGRGPRRARTHVPAESARVGDADPATDQHPPRAPQNPFTCTDTNTKQNLAL